MVFLLAALVVYRITVTKVDSAYDKEFIRDVLVEAHGMLFDILIIGTFIFALHMLVESRRVKKRNIERWQEEIDDFRGWDSEEAKFRIVGNIKRLNRNGITDINLIDSFLKNAILSRAHLEKAYLREAHLKGADFWKANLEGANLLDANLEEANLEGANLERTEELTIGQLSQVKTLYQAELDPELEKQIKKKYPHLLEKPKEEDRDKRKPDFSDLLD